MHAEQFVAVGEPHPDHPGGRPAHRPQRVVAGTEPDRLGMLADQEQVLLRRHQPRGDHLIVLAQVDRDDAARARRVEVTEPRLLHQPGGCREHQVRRDRVVPQRQHLGDALIRLEGKQVGDVLAAGVPGGVRQLVGLSPVDPALVGEEQDPVVGRGDEEVIHDVVGAQLRAAHALAAAPLGTVEVGPGALGVAAAGDRDDHVFLGDQVLYGHVAVVGDDLSPPVIAMPGDDLGKLSADDLALPLRRREDGLVLGNLGHQDFVLIHQLLPLEGGKLPQLHVEDGASLDLVDVQQVHQSLLGGHR